MIRRSLILALLTTFALCGMGRAQEQREYQLKAAFLYHFAQFVKWPGNAFAGPNAAFNIGILGDDPFGGALEDTIQGESIDGHKLAVVRSQNPDDLKDCQIVFVSRSENDHLGDVLPSLATRPILTVGDDPSFTHNGGIIDFYLSGGKVRFEINPASAQRSGLRINSQLLSLGKIVSTAGGGN